MAEKKRFKSLMRAPVATEPTAAPKPPQPDPLWTSKPVAPKTVCALTGRVSLRTLYNDSANGVDQKQWSIWLEEDKSLVPSYWFVVTEWGRVGWTLQQNRKRFPGETSARREYQKVLDSKLAKGYRS